VGARVHLHVGLQKSGTTYLQHAWADRLDELAAAGRRYPVDPSVRSEVPNHQRAFYGLAPEEFGWLGDRDYSSSWAWLQGELARATSPVLLSAEALSTLHRPGAARVVEALGADVEVLVTARPLDRLLASSWQQNVRNGRGAGFREYLETVRDHRAELLADHDDDTPILSWRSFSVGSLIERWSGLPGVSHVTVVVNSGRPADLLWRRTLEALDLAPDAIEPPQVAPGQTNEGLRWAEADILAALNRALAGPDWGRDEAMAVRKAVITLGFGDRENRGPGVTLPPQWQDEVAQWAEEDVHAVEASGARVVGPLSDLLPESAPASVDVVDLTTDDYSEAAAAALVGLLSHPHGEVKPRVLRRALKSVRRAG
jgi:hypothetical protein